MPEHDEHCEADQNAAKQELRHGARPLLGSLAVHVRKFRNLKKI